MSEVGGDDVVERIDHANASLGWLAAERVRGRQPDMSLRRFLAEAAARDDRYLDFDELGRVRGVRSEPPPRTSVPSNFNRRESLSQAASSYAMSGRTLTAFAHAPGYLDAPLATVLAIVRTAEATGQMKVYEDEQGPSGVLTWMWLSAYTIDRVKQGADFATDLHPCEWNEGSTLCFRDVAPSRRSAAAMAEDLGGGLFPEERSCLVALRSARSRRLELVAFSQERRSTLRPWLVGRFSPRAPESA